MTQGTRWEEAEAIARIRDAAPALLEAAKEALRLLSNTHNRGYGIEEVEPVYNGLFVAIAQAEGRRKPV